MATDEQPVPHLPAPSLLLATSIRPDRTLALLRSTASPARFSIQPASALGSHASDISSDLALATRIEVWKTLFDVFGPLEPEPDSSAVISTSDPAIQAALSSLGADAEGKLNRSAWFQGWRMYAMARSQFGEAGQGDPIEALGPPPRVPQQPKAMVSTVPAGGDKAVSHPLRLPQFLFPKPPSPIYSRYIPHLQQYLVLSIFGKEDHDVDLLHGWLNDPRVDKFWGDKGTREEHVEFLRKREEDDRDLPVMGSFTSGPDQPREPFGYFDVYWAAEDKIGRFFPAGPYDRGLHMLVGSSAHRGPHRVRAWLPSLCHYIFLAEPKTERVVSEPDARNERMWTYLQGVGFKEWKDVDMGHKVAKVMVLEREEFYRRSPF